MDPRFERLLSGQIELSPVMSRLLAQVKSIPGFDWLAYLESEPEEVVRAVREHNSYAYADLIHLLHLRRQDELIPSEDRDRDFTNLLGTRGGFGFNDDDFESARRRFQDFGFRIVGDVFYDIAAAMSPQEVEEATLRASELAATLKIDKLSQYEKRRDHVLAATTPFVDHPNMDRTAPEYLLYAMLSGLASVGKIRLLERGHGQQPILDMENPVTNHINHAYSLLAYLAWRFPGQNEDIATESLAYVLSNSASARRAFRSLIYEGGADIGEIDHVETQVSFTDGAKPDLVCYDPEGNVCALVESKFWAEFTPHQPNS